ncbi:MAG: hypothetical protein SFV15_08940 [Polyangiaceae bacterium]|nr:hypothetical protein [Polyangiaceae bacterium]
MAEPESVDAALREANQALSGRRLNEASRFASIELRAKDPQNRGWVALAVVCVALLALSLVLGAWFL